MFSHYLRLIWEHAYIICIYDDDAIHISHVRNKKPIKNVVGEIFNGLSEFRRLF